MTGSAMRCACIDIGSNTTRLLVGEVEDGRLRELRSERVFLRLGRALEPGAPVGRREIERLADVVAAQAALARALKASCVRTVATAAVRNAANRDAIVHAIAKVARVRVEVLGAEDEAALAFAGATGMADEPLHGLVGVADVGGGSTELVCGTVAGGPEWTRCVPLGSGLLAARRLHGDPPSAAQLAAARVDARAAFAAVELPPPQAALAVGGSATSLRLLCGAVLDDEALERALALLLAGPVARVAQELGLHPERVRMLPAGLLLLREAGAAMGGPLTVAQGGLREGVLLRLAASVPSAR
jgi:exopolyphosphatase/guanosine-5'-triphosphate,3'-diphosphate pyrophosphatase